MNTVYSLEYSYELLMHSIRNIGNLMIHSANLNLRVELNCTNGTWRVHCYDHDGSLPLITIITLFFSLPMWLLYDHFSFDYLILFDLMQGFEPQSADGRGQTHLPRFELAAQSVSHLFRSILRPILH